MERIANTIFLDPAIGFVTTYYSSRDRAMVSADGTQTFVVAQFQTRSDRRAQLGAERIRAELADDPGVRLGGDAPAAVDVQEIVAEDIATAELIAFPLLLLLALWIFRGLVAALLALGVGLLAGAFALAGLAAINEAIPISIFSLNLILGLSLALAVDYGLLIVTRYREELARAGSAEGALGATMRTAGRTVAFSAIAIALALASLLVFPQRFLYSMGIGGVLVAVSAAAAALIALPAALSLLGGRVNALAPARLQRSVAAEARPDSGGRWYRLAQLVMRRPAVVALACAALLIALGVPFSGARFIAVDTSVLPADAPSRQVREALTDRFGPNLSLPLLLVIDARPGPRADRLAEEVRELPGASRVDPPRRVGDRSVIEIAHAGSPLAASTEHLIERIRALEAPFETALGGSAAEYVDERERIADRLPLALGLLVGTTLLVLFAMTGSVLLPVKAVVLNALTLSVALGVLVWVFQDGRLEGLLGYETPGGLQIAQPLVLLAVGFGISTDYGVFMLARIIEARKRGAGDREAIALGLERTGRVLTAAALLVVVALGAFATSRIVFVKELGIGIAVAVIVDATIIRALLMPALMALLGRWNWWAPPRLRELHGRWFERGGGYFDGDAQSAHRER